MFNLFIMCTEPLYALRVKTDFDEKFKRFGKRTPLRVICAVRDIGKDTSKINYDPKTQDLLMISCGQCMQCRLLRVRQRSVMSICESLEHKENSFVTLTFGFKETYKVYKKQSLSYYLAKKKAHFHEWSLEKETFQKFMKRLRFWYYNRQLGEYLINLGFGHLVIDNNMKFKSHIRLSKEFKEKYLKDFKPKKIRCLHCGEYGSKHSRPHHHCILFGFQFPDLKPIYEKGQKYYTSKILSDLWPYGIHRIGECTFNSCAYVSRYVTKKVNGIGQDEFYDGRKPEYVTYSTKPVLGANYFLKNYKEFVNTKVVSVVADKKYECAIPRSYSNILKKIDINLYNKFKEDNVESSKTDLDKLLSTPRSIYCELDSRHKVCMSALRSLVRSFEEDEVPDVDNYILKARAFGVDVRHLFSSFNVNFKNYLDSKTYKSHIRRSSNQDILDKYYKFELARKRCINNCFKEHYTDKFIVSLLCFYKNMPNPFKVAKRGRLMPDFESLDIEEYIDEKGKVIYYE